MQFCPMPVPSPFYQQMDDRHLKRSYSDLENAGVISASWGIFKFLKIMLNQLTPVQEVLFFPKNGMRFIINLGYVNEKINAFGQVVVHFKGRKEKRHWSCSSPVFPSSLLCNLTPTNNLAYSDLINDSAKARLIDFGLLLITLNEITVTHSNQ